jgi:hypothetical protein
MLSVSITGADALRERLERMRRELMPRMQSVMNSTLSEAANWARMQRLSGPYPYVLQARTGRLRESFSANIRPGARVIVGQFGFINNRPIYAGVHEYGAVIRARPGRFLRFIPVGNIPLVMRGGRGRRSPFVFAKQVTIPARPVLRPTWARFRPLLIERLARQLERPF